MSMIFREELEAKHLATEDNAFALPMKDHLTSEACTGYDNIKNLGRIKNNAYSFLNGFNFNTEIFHNTKIKFTAFNRFSIILSKINLKVALLFGAMTVAASAINTAAGVTMGVMFFSQSACLIRNYIAPPEYLRQYIFFDFKKNTIETNLVAMNETLFTSLLIHEYIHASRSMPL